jgi:hypothetical protein
MFLTINLMVKTTFLIFVAYYGVCMGGALFRDGLAPPIGSKLAFLHPIGIGDGGRPVFAHFFAHLTQLTLLEFFKFFLGFDVQSMTCFIVLRYM